MYMNRYLSLIDDFSVLGSHVGFDENSNILDRGVSRHNKSGLLIISLKVVCGMSIKGEKSNRSTGFVAI